MSWSRKRINLEDLDLSYFDSRTVYDHRSGCLVWVRAKASGGYGYTGIARKLYYAHRLAYFLKWGVWADQAMHSCDNKSCCAWWHIKDGTRSDNMRDACAKGLIKRRKGEDHQRARLTAADVLEIRASSETHADLARRFGVGKTTIRHARSGQTWKHL